MGEASALRVGGAGLFQQALDDGHDLADVGLDEVGVRAREPSLLGCGANGKSSR